MFVIDASASMDFPASGPSKWAVGARLAAALAQVAWQSGDPVGAIIAGAPPRTVPLRSRQGIVTEIAEELGAVTPGGASGIVAAMTNRRLPARVVIISDFLDDDAALLRAAGVHRAKGGEIVALDVIARQELEPPIAPFAATDPERPSVVRAFGHSVAEAYADRFSAWREEAARTWRRIGARWLEVVTDEPVAAAVRRIVAP